MFIISSLALASEASVIRRLPRLQRHRAYLPPVRQFLATQLHVIVLLMGLLNLSSAPRMSQVLFYIKQ